jgi:hypothetical protein
VEELHGEIERGADVAALRNIIGLCGANHSDITFESLV